MVEIDRVYKKGRSTSRQIGTKFVLFVFIFLAIISIEEQHSTKIRRGISASDQSCCYRRSGAS